MGEVWNVAGRLNLVLLNLHISSFESGVDPDQSTDWESHCFCLVHLVDCTIEMT